MKRSLLITILGIFFSACGGQIYWGYILDRPLEDRKFAHTFENQQIEQVWEALLKATNEMPVTTIERVSHVLNTDWIEVGYSNYYGLVLVYDPYKKVIVDFFPSAKKRVKLIISISGVENNSTVKITSFEEVRRIKRAGRGSILVQEKAYSSYKNYILNEVPFEWVQIPSDGEIPEKIITEIAKILGEPGNFVYAHPVKYPTPGQSLVLKANFNGTVTNLQDVIHSLGLPENTTIQPLF